MASLSSTNEEDRTKIVTQMLQLVLWSISKEAINSREFNGLRLPFEENFVRVLGGYYPRTDSNSCPLRKTRRLEIFQTNGELQTDYSQCVFDRKQLRHNFMLAAENRRSRAKSASPKCRFTLGDAVQWFFEGKDEEEVIAATEKEKAKTKATRRYVKKARLDATRIAKAEEEYTQCTKGILYPDPKNPPSSGATIDAVLKKNPVDALFVCKEPCGEGEEAPVFVDHDKLARIAYEHYETAAKVNLMGTKIDATFGYTQQEQLCQEDDQEPLSVQAFHGDMPDDSAPFTVLLISNPFSRHFRNRHNIDFDKESLIDGETMNQSTKERYHSTYSVDGQSEFVYSNDRIPHDFIQDDAKIMMSS
jgi:hypothetical protein